MVILVYDKEVGIYAPKEIVEIYSLHTPPLKLHVCKVT